MSTVVIDYITRCNAGGRNRVAKEAQRFSLCGTKFLFHNKNAASSCTARLHTIRPQLGDTREAIEGAIQGTN